MAGFGQRFYYCQLASAGLIAFSDFVNYLGQTHEPTWAALGIIIISLAPSIPNYLWRISLALVLLTIQELGCKLRDLFEPILAPEIEARRSVGHSLYAADLVGGMIEKVQNALEYRATPILSWQKEAGLLASLGVLLFGVQEMLACSLLIILLLSSHFFNPGLYGFSQFLIQTLDALNFTGEMLRCGLETRFGDKRLKLQILLRETEISRYGLRTKPLAPCIIWTDENHRQPIPSPDIYRGVEASPGVSSVGWSVGPWMVVAAESFPSVSQEGLCARYRHWRQQYDIDLALADPLILASTLRPYLTQKT